MPTSSLQQDNLPNPVVSLQLRKVKKHVMVNYIMWDSFKMHWKKKLREREDSNIWVTNKLF